MFSIRNLAAAAIVATSAGAVGASTLTADFLTQGGAYSQTGGGMVEGEVYTVGGVELTFSSTASGPGNNTLSSAYLDGFFEDQEGGLGVCPEAYVDGASCTAAPRDEVNAEDTLTITFNRVVDVSNIQYLDREHNPLAVANAVVSGTDDVTSITFSWGDTDYYVASFDFNVVPLPAGGLLLLTALGGLGIARRRKKA